jgi:hypothetical protein
MSDSLDVLRVRRQALIDRCDAQRLQVDELSRALAGPAQGLGLALRAASLIKAYPAVAAVIALALFILKRRSRQGPAWRVLLLEPVIEMALRALWSGLKRARERREP